MAWYYFTLLASPGIQHAGLVLAENQGDGTFAWKPLPVEAQLAPIRAIQTGDFDADGHTDVLLASKFFGVKPAEGRYDASYGLLLRGDGQGSFRPMVHDSLTGEVRKVALVRRAGGHR